MHPPKPHFCDFDLHDAVMCHTHSICLSHHATPLCTSPPWRGPRMPSWSWSCRSPRGPGPGPCPAEAVPRDVGAVLQGRAGDRLRGRLGRRKAARDRARRAMEGRCALRLALIPALQASSRRLRLLARVINLGFVCRCVCVLLLRSCWSTRFWTAFRCWCSSTRRTSRRPPVRKRSSRCSR